MTNPLSCGAKAILIAHQMTKRARATLHHSAMSLDEPVFTVREVAEKLKVNEKTVQRLLCDEPGVIVIAFPRRGRRLYRTVRVPQRVLERILERFTTVRP